MAREVSPREPARPHADGAAFGRIPGGSNLRSSESGPGGWTAGTGHGITLRWDLHPSAGTCIPPPSASGSFAGIPGQGEHRCRWTCPWWTTPVLVSACLHLPWNDRQENLCPARSLSLFLFPFSKQPPRVAGTGHGCSSTAREVVGRGCFSKAFPLEGQALQLFWLP